MESNREQMIQGKQHFEAGFKAGFKGGNPLRPLLRLILPELVSGWSWDGAQAQYEHLVRVGQITVIYLFYILLLHDCFV